MNDVALDDDVQHPIFMCQMKRGGPVQCIRMNPARKEIEENNCCQSQVDSIHENSTSVIWIVTVSKPGIVQVV